MNALDKPKLRIELPNGWRESQEINEGQPVRVFHPPAPTPGVLRVLTDRIAADDASFVAVKMREVAVRFMRPDDARASDRVIEDRPGGGLIASATITATQEDGREETHYLWLLAEAGEGATVDAAMASLAMPRESDGEKAATLAASIVDGAIRGATMARFKLDTVCCGSCGGG